VLIDFDAPPNPLSPKDDEENPLLIPPNPFEKNSSLSNIEDPKEDPNDPNPPFFLPKILEKASLSSSLSKPFV
jgi:hypothetical protein